MTRIIEITDASHGNIRHNSRNQIRREIGRFTTVYVGERSGTVRDAEGRAFDWWLSETQEAAPGWPKVILIPAT